MLQNLKNALSSLHPGSTPSTYNHLHPAKLRCSQRAALLASLTPASTAATRKDDQGLTSGTADLLVTQNTAASSSSLVRRQSPPSEDLHDESCASINRLFRETVESGSSANMETIRRLSWHGCPASIRLEVWSLLTGYWHSSAASRHEIVLRKRADYQTYVKSHYAFVDWDAALSDDSGVWELDLSKRFSQTMKSGTSCSSSAVIASQTRLPSELSLVVTEGESHHPDIPLKRDTSIVRDSGTPFVSRTLAESISLSSDPQALTSHAAIFDEPLPRRSAVRKGAASSRISRCSMVSSQEKGMLKQIRKDIPRMSGGVSYLQHRRVQQTMERILFIWSVRHPACGYVQGMNDLIVPFLSVTLAALFCPSKSVTELDAYDETVLCDLWSEAAVPEDRWMAEVEADVYWMSSYLLETIQDNFTYTQAGVRAMTEKLAMVVRVAYPSLYRHLVDDLQLEFIQFSFRWMNCLLFRELTGSQVIRLLDAYLSDEQREWCSLHVYVCAALLFRFGPELLQEVDFCRALAFLQNVPTGSLTMMDMDELLSTAFLLQQLYGTSLLQLQKDFIH